jgi:hypothetical protein
MNATSELIWWNSKEGKKRLYESNYANHFYALAHLFERQVKPTYCGIASAVMVLNALRLGKKGLKLETSLDVQLPEKGKLSFNCYTQITFFNADTRNGKSRVKVEGKCTEEFNPGFSLTELAYKLRILLLNAEVILASEQCDKSVDRFRQDLMAHLNGKGTYIIANFLSTSIGRDGGGHFSPIVAYHPSTDSCLVMDVAGHKNPWFWVPVPLFYTAMHNCDEQNAYRGYMLVSDKLDK